MGHNEYTAVKVAQYFILTAENTPGLLSGRNFGNSFFVTCFQNVRHLSRGHPADIVFPYLSGESVSLDPLIKEHLLIERATKTGKVIIDLADLTLDGITTTDSILPGVMLKVPITQPISYTEPFKTKEGFYAFAETHDLSALGRFKLPYAPKAIATLFAR